MIYGEIFRVFFINYISEVQNTKSNRKITSIFNQQEKNLVYGVNI